MADDIDPFDSLLNIEEDFYGEGYQQGYQDGLRQSSLETRLFGIEKGFEKFVVMGKLQAKAAIWANRLQAMEKSTKIEPIVQSGDALAQEKIGTLSAQIQPLSHNSRLEKHIQTLLALVDQSTLSIANTDDAVAEFDDRLKRAQAKEKVIDRIIGGTSTTNNSQAPNPASVGRSTVDFENFGSR